MHVERFLEEVVQIAREIESEPVEKLADELLALRERDGRLFLIGLGGSAANCSHAAADFRNLCEIDTCSLTDNFAAFSAQANDHGFDVSFTRILESLRLNHYDALLVLSVGGGTDRVSVAISNAVRYAKSQKAKVFGVVGHIGGVTALLGDVVIKVPQPNPAHVTPHAEAFQAVLWHCLVSHPKLQRNSTKW